MARPRPQRGARPEVASPKSTEPRLAITGAPYFQTGAAGPRPFGGETKIILPMTRDPGIDLDQAGLSGDLRHGSKGQAYCGFPDGEEGGGEIVVTGLAGLTGALGAAGAL